MIATPTPRVDLSTVGSLSILSAVDQVSEHLRKELIRGSFSGTMPGVEPLAKELGVNMPYRLFEKDNDRVRDEVLSRYLTGINQFRRDPIEDCLASDGNRDPCVEAMSAFDLEQKVHLPKGNIFHGGLSWPFAESDEEVSQWGVKTKNPNIFLCGSAAKRGGQRNSRSQRCHESDGIDQK